MSAAWELVETALESEQEPGLSHMQILLTHKALCLNLLIYLEGAPANLFGGTEQYSCKGLFDKLVDYKQQNLVYFFSGNQCKSLPSPLSVSLFVSQKW